MDDFLKNKFKYIKITIAIGIGFFLAGAIFVTFSSQLPVDPFWISMCSVFGLMFLVIGVAKYLLFSNEKYAKNYKINEADERNTIIRERAAYLAFMFSNLVLAVLTVIFVSLDMMVVFQVTGILLASQYIVFFILCKYYDKKL